MGQSSRDIAAFAEFVEARSAALFRTAYLVVGDYQLAQDLIQESLVKTLMSWGRLRDPANVEAYARRVIVTTAISWRRRRSFHEQPVERMPEAFVPDQIEALVTRDELWAAMRSLAPRQRTAVVLRFFEDLSEAQTADIMGCSIGAVKSQTAAGINRLRDRLGRGPGILPLEDRGVTS